MAGLKEVWDSVDNARKAWAIIAAVGGAILSCIGVDSLSFRIAILCGAFLGCIFSYWFTTSYWSGKGKDACLRASKWHLGLFCIPAFVVIALIVVLEPDTARAISTEQVYNLLISSHILPNLIAGIGCFFAMYLLVGAIVLTSPTLWTHQPTP